MRTKTKILDNGNAYSVEIPDSVCMAFNPCIISIEQTSGFSPSFFTIEIGGKTIQSAVRGELTTIDVSNLFKSLFTDIKENRSINTNIRIYEDASTLITEDAICALYASIEIGERLKMFGAFDMVRSTSHYERHLVWFPNFPMKSSYFVTTYSLIFTREDNKEYLKMGLSNIKDGYVDISTIGNAKNRYVVNIKNDAFTSEFSDEFSYQFMRMGKNDTIIYYHVCNRKNGYFLRWIDKRGYWQSYLFDKGSIEHKSKIGNYSKSVLTKAGGMYFDGSINTEIETSKTITCCAPKLADYFYEEVSTIIGACYVELFVGYDENQSPIFMPISLEAANLKKNNKNVLNDVEISFTIKESNPTL